MIYDRKALAKYKLQRSYEAIADTDLLLKSGSVSGSLSMALRAASDAAEAGLLAAGKKEIRSESLLFLAAQLVRDGQLGADAFNAFRTIMDLCTYANDRDFSNVNRHEAAAAVNNVKLFVREMEGLVKQLTKLSTRVITDMKGLRDADRTS
jgi:hypothetical protein